MKRIGCIIAALALVCVSALAHAEKTPAPEATVQPLLETGATPSEATPSEATPSEATPSEATPSEATPSEATPSEATDSEVTPSEEAVSEAAVSEETPARAQSALPDGLGERILLYGLEGDDVALMQQRLLELGYYTGEVDGAFGRQTRSAVYAFQRAHGLAKVDGKAGPETLGRMFADDAIARPTPSPTATPKPTPTPTPSPSPTPSPEPSATPDVANAPFEMEEAALTIGGNRVTLFIGRDEAGNALYPLCGVLSHRGYAYAFADGSWQFTGKEDGAELALMTDGTQGLCEGALFAVEGVIFLTDEEKQVYAYGGEAYVTRSLLEAFGVSVSEAGGVTILQ